MLYDAYGRPVRSPNELVTPSWVTEEIWAWSRDNDSRAAAEMRRLRFREANGLPYTVEGSPVGDTVRVRKPAAFTGGGSDGK